jgi:hypothetical protein
VEYCHSILFAPAHPSLALFQKFGGTTIQYYFGGWSSLFPDILQQQPTTNMSGLSRSSHSHTNTKSRRSIRRSATIGSKSSSQGRLNLMSSMGRDSLLRQHSSRSFRRREDAFGKDIFDIDPSAEFNNSDSFSTSFDEIPVLEEELMESPWENPNKPRKQVLKKSKSPSQSELLAKSGSHRSLRSSSSQRRLTSTSLRNVTEAWAF